VHEHLRVTKSPPTVTCIGELLWDVLPTGRTLGGAPANVAYHLAQLGLGVRIVTRIGRDELGAAALAELRRRRLPVADVQYDDVLETGAAYVSLDATGHPDYRFVTPAAWDAIEPPGVLPDVVVFGSLAQRDSRSESAVREVLAHAALRIYDVNLRPPFTPLEVVARSLPLATIVKVNADEARQIATFLDLPAGAADFAAALASRYALRMVCITRGPEGAAMWTDGVWTEVDGLPIVPVDTVGAGDAFLAALIHGWLAGSEPRQVLGRANRLGACVATRRGAMPEYDVSELST
jgi:fructokinase